MIKTHIPLMVLLSTFLIPLAPTSALLAQSVAIITDKTSGCAPLTVNFNARLDPGYTNVEWDFSVGAKVTGNLSPSRIFTTPGTYHVTLTVQYPGTQIVKSVDINVFNNPQVSFTVDNTSGCTPLTAHFTDQSDPGQGTTIANILWNFGDGAADQGTTVTHQFTSPGTYNVISLVTNSQGCKASGNPVSITVKEIPVLSFTADQTKSCSAPFTVTFQNTTVNNTGTPISYMWDYGDGSTGTDASHTYTAEGSYTVTLIPTTPNSCATPLQKKNYIVIQQIVPGFSAQTKCPGDQVTLTSTTTPTPDNITWTLPDGSTASGFTAGFIAGAPGSYTVKMALRFGSCSREIQQTVVVDPRPVVDPIATPLRGCTAPFTTSFQAQSQFADSWQWNFGDGTTSTAKDPFHTYTSNGTFSVTLTATNSVGCATTVTRTNYINISLPALTITPSGDSGCIPYNVSFTAALNPAEAITDYQWDFGDGTTSTLPNPAHTYTQQGAYTVSLRATSALGCIVNANVAFRVGTPPVIDFTASPLQSCPMEPVQFTNLSTPKGPGVTYLWIFPQDNSSSTEENPAHRFTEPGLHDIRLIVNNNGCISQLVKTQYIKIQPPKAEFTTTPDCDDFYHRKFTDQSNFGPAPAQKQWLWNFGEGGATSTLQNPDFRYTSTGKKTVTLTIFDGVCHSTTSTDIYIIDEKPVLLPDTTQICLGKSLHVGIGPVNPANIRYYLWDWGDGTVLELAGTDIDPAKGLSHTYQRSGTYVIQLTLGDSNRCKRIAPPVTITVHGAMTNFTVTGQPCKNNLLTFADQSTIDAGNRIVNWTWNFGDGSPDESSTTQPLQTTHRYTDFNAYVVTLTATDQYGCQTKTQQTVNISVVKADFTVQSGVACKNSPITFTSTSTGDIVDYAWDFGDNTTGTGANPVKTYSAPGTYNVSLKVTSRIGCTDQISKPGILQVPNPVADFTFPSIQELCPPVKVQFTNTSSGFTRSAWDFGDNSTSTQNDPGAHIYVKPGTYNVTLTVYADGNCSAVKTAPVTVEGPQGSFTATPVTGCVPLPVTMTATANKTVTYQWDFDDGIVVTTSTPQAPPHTYAQPGIYTPRVSLVDNRGCAVKADGNYQIVADKMTANFTVDNSAACGGGNVLFKNTSTAVTNDSLHLPFSSKWIYSDGSTSVNTNGSFTYPATGTYQVTLEMTSSYGCKDSKTLPVLVPTQPQPTITPIPELCISGTVQLHGTDNRNIPNTLWKWQLGNGLQYNVPNPPDVNINTVGITPVTLTITNADGSCPGVANTNIVVHPAPNLRPTPAEATICKGASLQLSANTDPAATVSWTPYNISSATSKTPVVRPDQDTTYTVKAVSEFGCKNEATVSVRVIQPFKMFALNASICFGKSIQMQTGGAFRYQWSPSEGLDHPDIAEPVASPSRTITYRVVGFDQAGCFTDTTFATVTVNPLPQVDAGPDVTVSTGTKVPITAKGSSDITGITWQPPAGLSCNDCLTPVATAKSSITYHISVMNQYGCIAGDDIHITTLCNGANIFIPNTFSPNGDGMNDVFYIRGTGLQSVRVFRIYNRLGQVMFERFGLATDDASAGWDGRYKGVLLNPDVFVYYAEVVCDNGESTILKGNITLIR
ncbi:PKD domain-containing protein [Chitinophaga sp. 22536]|uniref:PKD domain-containing protein n=1 Tax=unclassified Chitinophaga TaxID=2619133 RepID=UPI003F87033A